MLSYAIFLFTLSGLAILSESTQQAFKRDPGHPHWHHSAFLEVRDSVRSDVRRTLHTRAEVIDSRSENLVKSVKKLMTTLSLPVFIEFFF